MLSTSTLSKLAQGEREGNDSLYEYDHDGEEETRKTEGRQDAKASCGDAPAFHFLPEVQIFRA